MKYLISQVWAILSEMWSFGWECPVRGVKVWGFRTVYNIFRAIDLGLSVLRLQLQPNHIALDTLQVKEQMLGCFSALLTENTISVSNTQSMV